MTHTKASSRAAVAVMLSAVALGACSTVEVQPWEKSTLAQVTMKPAGAVPALSKIDAHIYYSKEAVRGGNGIGGGGCGCN